MDPWLQEIIDSQKAERPGGEYTQAKPLPEDPATFAAPTQVEAVRRNWLRAAGLLDPNSKISKLRKFIELMQELNMPAGPANPAIIAGAKGATNLGGQVLKRYKTGEAVSEMGHVPSQELWRSYGYAKGAEGKGRFEISDLPAQLKEGARKAKTVGEALEHPELFNAYPDLAKIPLELRISSLMSSGHYNPEAEVIKAWGLGDQEAKSVLLHELQHAVQKREGFAPGANLRGGKDLYERSAGEQEAYNVQRRLADPDLMRFTPEMTESLPREMQIIRTIQDANKR